MSTSESIIQVSIEPATSPSGRDLLEGVKRKGSIARTQTLVVRGLSKTVRYINSIHNLDFKDEKITHLVK